MGPGNQRLISRSTGSLSTEFRFENFDQLEPKRHQIKSTICSAAGRKKRGDKIIYSSFFIKVFFI